MADTILVQITVYATFPKSHKSQPRTTGIVHPVGSSPHHQPKVEFRVHAREGYTAEQVAVYFLSRDDWGQHAVSGDIWTWHNEQVRLWATDRMHAVLDADN